MEQLKKEINNILNRVYRAKNSIHKPIVKLLSEGDKCVLAEESYGKTYLILAYEKSLFYKITSTFLDNSTLEKNISLDGSKGDFKYRISYVGNREKELIGINDFKNHTLDKIKKIDVVHNIHHGNDKTEIVFSPID